MHGLLYIHCVHILQVANDIYREAGFLSKGVS